MNIDRKLTFSIHAETIEGKTNPKPGDLEVVGLVVDMNGRPIARKVASRIRSAADVGEFVEDVMHGQGGKPDAEGDKTSE